jgi:hypothetical protein
MEDVECDGGGGTTIFPDESSSSGVRTRMRTKTQKLTPIQIEAGGIAGLVYRETIVVLDEPPPAAACTSSCPPGAPSGPTGTMTLGSSGCSIHAPSGSTILNREYPPVAVDVTNLQSRPPVPIVIRPVSHARAVERRPFGEGVLDAVGIDARRDVKHPRAQCLDHDLVLACCAVSPDEVFGSRT